MEKLNIRREKKIDSIKCISTWVKYSGVCGTFSFKSHLQ